MLTTRNSYIFLTIFCLSHTSINAMHTLPHIVDNLHENKNQKLSTIVPQKEYEIQLKKQARRFDKKSRMIQRNQQRQHKFDSLNGYAS